MVYLRRDGRSETLRGYRIHLHRLRLHNPKSPFLGPGGIDDMDTAKICNGRLEVEAV